MNKETKEITAEDLINWSVLSQLMTGRPDILRVNRVGKKNINKVDKLKLLINFWIHENKD